MRLIQTLILGVSSLLLFQCNDPHRTSGFDHDIEIREIDGRAVFYNQYWGEPFVPRGVNLVAPDGHTLLNTDSFDPTALENTLVKLKSYGYNTVRIWVNTTGENGLSDPEDRDYEGHDGFNPPYIAFLNVLLDKLNYTQMYAIITIDWLPYSDPYRSIQNRAGPDFANHNLGYLSAAGHEANALFWKNFARRMKLSPLSHHILGYEIRNEVFYEDGIAPFDKNAAGNYLRTAVTTADGNTYDITVDTERNQMMRDNLNLFFRTVKDAIHEVDETVLVSAGLIHMGFGKIGDPVSAMRADILDFIDLHIYPHEYHNSMAEYADYFELHEAPSVPIIVGEFGAKRGRWSRTAFTWPGYQPDGSLPADYVAGRDLVQWQMAMCQYGIQGWLTWDYDSLSDFFSAVADESMGDAYAERSSRPLTRPVFSYTSYYLSPLVRADPCSISVNVGPPIQE